MVKLEEDICNFLLELIITLMILKINHSYFELLM